nr:MAG TPA: DNA-binding protein [Bacteriophage sp.]
MRKQIEELLQSKISTSAIAKGAGLPWSTVADLRNGKTNLDKMALITAEKLQKYAEELEMKREQEILDIIKEMELEADMLDIWENENGDISIQSRGVVPADEKELSLKYVGYVDNGQVWFE